jgi:hypothetical protein
MLLMLLNNSSIKQKNTRPRRHPHVCTVTIHKHYCSLTVRECKIFTSEQELVGNAALGFSELVKSLPIRFFSTVHTLYRYHPLAEYWARISKRSWSPGIDSKESTQLAYVAWRAGTTNRPVVPPARQAENRFLGSLKGLQMRAPL